MQQEVEQAFVLLHKHFPMLESNSLEYDPAEASVTIEWPSKDCWSNYSANKFLEDVPECVAMELDPEAGVVTTPTRYYQLVEDNTEDEDVYLPLTYTNEEGFRFYFAVGDLVITCAALKAAAYDRYNWPTRHTAIVVDFSNAPQKPNHTTIRDLLDSYLFEIADTYDQTFTKGQFINPEEFYNEIYRGRYPGRHEPAILRPLEPPNGGMRLFLAALQVADPELQLFSYYKVFEYFTPVVFSLEAHEALRKKLDSSKALHPDGEYLKSILDLTRSLELRKNDKELLRLVFVRCLDLVELARLLPPSLPNVPQPISYESKSSELEKHGRAVSDCLLATRNQVAHAKSNYEPTGLECPVGDISTFNRYLKVAAAHVIRWYNRLPHHQRMDL